MTEKGRKGKVNGMESINDNRELLEQVMTMISKHFGKKCEIALHDFSTGDNHTIVDIRNGEVTGRSVGGCATNIGLEIMRGKPAKDSFNYITYSPDGHVLRSSSIYFHNAEGKAIGSLCINLDITDSVYYEKWMREYNNLPENDETAPKEIFTTNVGDLLDVLIDHCIQKFGKPPKLLSKEEKIQFIAELDSKGVFSITKSSDRVYSLLGISRYTFYNYLDLSRKGETDKKEA